MGSHEDATIDQADVAAARTEVAAGLTKPLPKSPSREIEDRPSLKDRMRSTLRGTDRSPKAQSPKGETVAEFPQTARPDLNKPIPRLPISPHTPTTPPKTWSGMHDASIVPKPLFFRKPIPTFMDPFGPDVQHIHARSHSDPNSDMSSFSRRNSFSANETTTLDDDVPPIPPLPTNFYRVPPLPPHSTLQTTIPYRKPPAPPIPPPPSRSTFPQAYRKPIPLRSSSDFPLTSATHAFTHYPLLCKDNHTSSSARSSSSSKYSDHPQETTKVQVPSQSSSPSKHEAGRVQKHQKKSSLHIITPVGNANAMKVLKRSSSIYSISLTGAHEDEGRVVMFGRISTAGWPAEFPIIVPRSEKGDSTESSTIDEECSTGTILRESNIVHNESGADHEESGTVHDKYRSPQETSNEQKQDIYGIEIRGGQERMSQGLPPKTALDGLPSVPGSNWQAPSREPPIDARGEPIVITQEEDFRSRVDLIKERMRWYCENIEAKHKTLLREEKEGLSAKDLGRELLRKAGIERRGKRKDSR